MTKYRVVKEEKSPDEFVYVPQEKFLWFWSAYVEGQNDVRMEFQTEAGAVAYIRAQVKDARPLRKPKVVWQADTESIGWRAGSDTIYRD